MDDMVMFNAIREMCSALARNISIFVEKLTIIKQTTVCFGLMIGCARNFTSYI